MQLMVSGTISVLESFAKTDEDILDQLDLVCRATGKTCQGILRHRDVSRLTP